MNNKATNNKNELPERDVWGGLLKREEGLKLLERFKPNNWTVGFTKEEAKILFAWAEGIRMRNTVLELALEGAVETSLRDGKVIVRAVPDAEETESASVRAGKDVVKS